MLFEKCSGLEEFAAEEQIHLSARLTSRLQIHFPKPQVTLFKNVN